jgi:hypothetical protein
VIIKDREHAVRGTVSILERRVQRGAAGTARESLRRITRQRAVKSDSADISVELPRVAVLALIVS